MRPADWFQRYIHVNPKLDPTGEWVAWSGYGVSWITGIFVRGLREHPTAPLVSVPGYSLEFCDWTEDSFILANGSIYNEAGGILILRLDGTVVRRVPTEVPPMRGTIAAYRKFGHH